MIRMLWRWGWRAGCGAVLLWLLPSCAGRVPPTAPPPASKSHTTVQYGTASWYGQAFHGRPTATGESYDMFALTAAHCTAPLGSRALVTNLTNGRTVQVRINDRGPFVDHRILDLSYAAALQLGMVTVGLAPVRIEFLGTPVSPPAFVVQAGAYIDQANAVRVQQTLAAQYLQVWLAPTRDGAVSVYRVRLGPFANRAMADEVARRVVALGYAASVLELPLSTAPSVRTEPRL
jgi:peptidoglycan lytic transglycosylase